ncbi:hypothetical protein [uncultured Alsobacter sp.]|uniref:hypothetical protein n=1 Tax=uncultured Alsobacter sp. TaxID=1748258 RepID=UPI0025CBFDE1|nr:hypothetical protein [uncultured Alsobacter sp.]
MASDAAPSGTWTRFLVTAGVSAALLSVAVVLFAFVFDPFGVGPFARRANPVLMDLNQRFMYPQIVRSGRFDAAIAGTSTIRLVDPQALDAAYGARFANLAMNSATAWEQTQIVDLFLRQVPAPRALIWSLDPLWCAPDAADPRQRLTFRAFPATFYDDNPWNDWPELFNLKSLELAWRMLLYRAGAMPERYRNDGYEVFTPPESTYDLARARQHLWGGPPRVITPREPPYVPAAGEREGWVMPALAWLDQRLSGLPAATRVVLVFPPTHVSAHPQPGSEAAAKAAECKGRVARIATRRGATVLDFQQASPVTLDDSRYWDPLHYRLDVARRIESALNAVATGQAALAAQPQPFWTVLVPPTR